MRRADHIGKRLGIGEPELAADPARGFDRALGADVDDESYASLA